MPSKVPEGWQVTPISSLLAWDSPGFWGDEPGGASPSVKVLRSTNFTDGGRLDLGDIAERVFPERVRTAKRLRVGDLLLERSGGGPNKPVGRVCLFEEQGEYFYSNFIQGLRCRPEVDHRFAFYLLWHLHNAGTTRQLQQATTGIRNLAYNDYLAWTLTLPPLPEQKKIATILSSVDEAIQATQRVIDQTRRVKEGLLQDLLTRGLPGHTRFKPTEIGEIPESWEVRRLDRISPSLSVGLVINPSTYFAEDGTVPMLVGSNIKENGIDWKGVRRISTASNETLRSTQIYEGDLVTVRVGNPGLTLVVPPELDGSNCASVMIVRRHDHFDSNWLCAALNSRQGTRQFAAVQYGTAQKQFNISHAVKFKFAVPPLAEQRAIAAITATMNEQTRVSEGALSKLQRVKAGLLQDLLTGKVRVST